VTKAALLVNINSPLHGCKHLVTKEFRAVKADYKKVKETYLSTTEPKHRHEHFTHNSKTYTDNDAQK